MRDALRSYLTVADELTKAPRRRAAALARTLAAEDEGRRRSDGPTEDELTSLVRREIDRKLAAMALATADEVRALALRVAALEAQLRTSGTADPRATADAAGAAVDKAVRSARKVTAAGRPTAPVVGNRGGDGRGARRATKTVKKAATPPPDATGSKDSA